MGRKSSRHVMLALVSPGRIEPDVAAKITGPVTALDAREDVVRVTPELRNVPDVEKNDVYSAYHNTIGAKVLGMTRRHDIADEDVRIVEGDPGEVLPRYVNRETANIVILGAVGRSWLQRALVGHTAERVLDAMRSDVLVVKPPDFRSGVSRQSVHHLERGAMPRGRLIW